jgi:tetratricopeptide (TPR) repeat protein
LASNFNIGGTPPVSTPPVSPLGSSRALTRVTPVAPQRVTETSQSPLGRSGLDVRGLIGAPDQIVVRSQTPSAALQLGLEQARGAMVRNSPADALAALDDVWTGAQHTETGWYLRGGSLALLGLPGEASRVATEALHLNPNSAAIHFLQSLSRLTLGDASAAQSALSNALAHSDPEAVLLIQQAVLAAERGDTRAAEELLRRATHMFPGHPALEYGRAQLRELVRARARERRTPTAAQHAVEVPVDDTALSGENEPQRVTSHQTMSTHGSSSGDPLTARDVVLDALMQLGAQLRSGTRKQSMSDVRALLASLSAGGTLAGSVPAARAHAIRALLSAVLESLNAQTAASGSGWDAESVDGEWRRSEFDWIDERTTPAHRADSEHALRSNEVLMNTVRVVVGALRDGRTRDAELQLKRARGTVGESTLQLLAAIVGSDEGSTARTPANGVAAESPLPVQSYIASHALLTPLRLGLALLPQRERALGNVAMPHNEDAAVSFAGSASAVAFASERFDRHHVPGSVGSVIASLGLVAGAVLAFSASLPIVAIALAGGGAWLAMRRGAHKG